ncbi:hypothetical protein SNEBB_003361 [Seison nebaliae]|nr:hypothetical protein SNEBB_003361 [Seison nebaliae]
MRRITSNKVQTSFRYLQDEPYRHPLNDKWSFWFYRNNSSNDNEIANTSTSNNNAATNSEFEWKRNMKRVVSMETVEDLFLVMDALLFPSQLSNGDNYMFFRHHIEPMWETSHNKDGGSWELSIGNCTVLDTLWQQTIYALVTNRFGEKSNHINGIFVKARQRGNKLSIWTDIASSEDKETLQFIGLKWKEILGLKLSENLTFRIHSLPSRGEGESKLSEIVV